MRSPEIPILERGLGYSVFKVLGPQNRPFQVTQVFSVRPPNDPGLNRDQ
jgi:hypothetical protein